MCLLSHLVLFIFFVSVFVKWNIFVSVCYFGFSFHFMVSQNVEEKKSIRIDNIYGWVIFSMFKSRHFVCLFFLSLSRFFFVFISNVFLLFSFRIFGSVWRCFDFFFLYTFSDSDSFCAWRFCVCRRRYYFIYLFIYVSIWIPSIL